MPTNEKNKTLQETVQQLSRKCSKLENKLRKRDEDVDNLTKEVERFGDQLRQLGTKIDDVERVATDAYDIAEECQCNMEN